MSHKWYARMRPLHFIFVDLHVPFSTSCAEGTFTLLKVLVRVFLSVTDTSYDDVVRVC